MSVLKEPTGQAFLWPSDAGWYYVRYNCEQISGLMTKRAALGYAEMFGGTVHKHSKAPKWWQFWAYSDFRRLHDQK